MNHQLKLLKFTQVFLDTVIQQLHMEFKFILFNGNSTDTIDTYTNTDQRRAQTTHHIWVYSATW